MSGVPLRHIPRNEEAKNNEISNNTDKSEAGLGLEHRLRSIDDSFKVESSRSNELDYPSSKTYQDVTTRKNAKV